MAPVYIAQTVKAYMEKNELSFSNHKINIIEMLKIINHKKYCRSLK